MGREVSVQEIFEWTSGFIYQPSSKRFEENIKFIFKLAFKKLKTNMLKKNRISSYSKKFDVQFYNFYFLELAVTRGLQIEEFYDPLNSKSGTKTLNNDYLKLVFSSDQFRKDFLGYISSDEIFDDYQANLKRKIRQLLFKFDRLFDQKNEENERSGIVAIQSYFRRNRQCKLPWLQSEIHTAIQTFCFMVRSLFA